MFAYCGNNPVMFSDYSGEFFLSSLAISVIVGAIIVGTVGAIAGNSYANAKGYTGVDKARCIITGGVIGAVAGGIMGYYAAPAISSAFGISGVSITLKGGIVIVPLHLTGQLHHVLSNPIMKALENHSTLRGLFDRVGSVVKAMYDYSHKGYQKWHRDIDNHMVDWLNNHPNASKIEFWKELYKLYNTRDMIKRFGEGVLEYIKQQMNN